MSRTNRTKRSIDELLSFDRWSNSNITLSPSAHGEVWRASDRDAIKIQGARDFTLDGASVAIYGHALELEDCKRVTLKNLTIRVGSIGFGKKDEAESLSLRDCEDVTVKNCHLAWGTDETFAIVSCKNISVLKCIVSEALDKPKTPGGDWIHSEKERHGFGLLIRGSKNVTVEGCLVARCQKRSPSVTPKGKYAPDVKVESCVSFDYVKHGAKFNSSDVRHNDKMRYRLYYNYFIADDQSTPAIEIDKPKSKLLLKTRSNRDRNGQDPEPDFDDGTALTESTTTGKLEYVREQGNDRRELADILREAGPRPRLREDVRLTFEVLTNPPTFKPLLKDERDAPEFDSVYRSSTE